jgi:hypothetical protein
MCCSWKNLSTCTAGAAALLPQHVPVLQKCVLCFWRYLFYSTASCSARGLIRGILWKPVLPVDLSARRKTLLPGPVGCSAAPVRVWFNSSVCFHWTCLFYSSLCCPWTYLFYSSLCCPRHVYSTEVCDASGRVCSIEAWAIHGRICSILQQPLLPQGCICFSAVCAAPGRARIFSAAACIAPGHICSTIAYAALDVSVL